MSDPVRVHHDDRVTTITISRPDKRNALDREVLTALGQAIEALADRTHGTRCAILTGEGKAFVAGADISAMKSMTVDEARGFSRLGHDVLDSLEALPFPVIAAVNGFALGGGCELALACDFIYASETAKLGQPEVKLGVIPGFGGSQRLPRRVGDAVARELVYTGAMISAEEAFRIGLVNRVFAPEALMEGAAKTAREIAAVGPLATRAAKELVADGAHLSLSTANALEIEAFAGCFATEDQKEGMDAFLGKRSPEFTGK